METTLQIALDADFLEAAQATEREPADIVAGLMRDFVDRERASYRDFLAGKVAVAQRTADAGGVRSHDEVERYFAEKKRQLGLVVR